MARQTGREKAWAELAGISMTGYNDVFMQFAASNGWTGTFNDRMIKYLQSITLLTTSNLPDLERKTADLLGLSSWNEVGYEIITLSGPPPVVWTPQDLFLSGELGGWYDPSDLSTLWQDDAGTIPVTADGQTVARIDDKSGNGNHLRSDSAGTGRLAPLYKTAGGVSWLESVDAPSGLSASLGSEASGPLTMAVPYTLAVSANSTNTTLNSATSINIKATVVAAGSNFLSMDRVATSGTGRAGVNGANLTPVVAAANSAVTVGSTPAGTDYRLLGEFLSGSVQSIQNNSILGPVAATTWTTQTEAGQISFGGDETGSKTYGFVVISRPLTAQEKVDLDTWLLGQYT